jgi:hypothetical protein
MGVGEAPESAGLLFGRELEVAEQPHPIALIGYNRLTNKPRFLIYTGGGCSGSMQIPRMQPSRDKFVLFAVILSCISILLALLALILAIFIIFGYSVPSLVVTTFGNLVTFVLPTLVLGIVVSVAVQVIRQRLFALRDWADQRRLEQIKQKISTLSTTNPELALVLELINETEQMQRAKASGRAFWQGVAQNFIFYIVGVMTPLILLRFHFGG